MFDDEIERLLDESDLDFSGDDDDGEYLPPEVVWQWWSMMVGNVILISVHLGIHQGADSTPTVDLLKERPKIISLKASCKKKTNRSSHNLYQKLGLIMWDTCRDM